MKLITKTFLFLLGSVIGLLDRAFIALGLPAPFAGAVCWATPMTSGQFGDLLDVRFQKIFDREKKEPKDMIPLLYADISTNGRNDIRFSEVGEMPDWGEFNGAVSYSSFSQGYDVTITPVEFASGFQIERKLFDDDQYHIMDQRPTKLARGYRRRRQKDAARIFINAFSVDSFFYNHSEGVALCSDSHTTTSGASTASGFDNRGTAAFSAVALQANWLQMKNFRGDVGEVLDMEPNEIWYPPALHEQVWEVVKSMGKVDGALNNRNVHEGMYDMYSWNRMSDTNDWFVCDSTARKENLFWTDRVAVEFAMVEDFDTLVAKWRGYARYGLGYQGWRWLVGNQVS